MDKINCRALIFAQHSAVNDMKQNDEGFIKFMDKKRKNFKLNINFYCLFYSIKYFLNFDIWAFKNFGACVLKLNVYLLIKIKHYE